MILAYYFGLHFKLHISYHRHDERKEPNKTTHKKLKNNSKSTIKYSESEGIPTHPSTTFSYGKYMYYTLTSYLHHMANPLHVQ